MNGFPWTPYVLTIGPMIYYKWQSPHWVRHAETKEGLKPKHVIGAVAYAGLLAVLSSVNPEIATALAWLVMLTSVLTYGGEIFAHLTDWNV